jgi:hypothetical protein
VEKNRKYRDRYLRWHKTYEKRANTELRRLFKRWASDLKVIGTPDMWEGQIDQQMPLEDLIKTYVLIYREIGLKHGERVGKEINIQHKAFNPDVFKEFYERYIALYLQQYGMNRIEEVRQVFVEFIANMMRERALEVAMFGDSPDPSRIATWIQQSSRKRGFYRWQALRIARTESTAASNLGGLRAAESSGYLMEKVWVSAHDSRTRRKPDDRWDHWHMDGKRVDKNESFEMTSSKGSLDRLQYPGDPKGSPGNIINCRCTLIYEPKRDANGLIIRA